MLDFFDLIVLLALQYLKEMKFIIFQVFFIFLNNIIIFLGKKAVDILVDSKKYGMNSKAPKFSNQAAAEDFLNKLLDRGLFFRAKKVVLKKKEKIKQEMEKKIDKSKVFFLKMKINFL